MKMTNLFLGGEWTAPVEGGTREILNPATSESLAVVADASAQDAEIAVAHARKAFDEGPWSRTRADRKSVV